MLALASDKVFIIFRPRANLYFTPGILQKWSGAFFLLPTLGKYISYLQAAELEENLMEFFSPQLLSWSLGEAILFS